MESERGRARPASALARIRRDSSLEVAPRSRLGINLSLSPRRTVKAAPRQESLASGGGEKELRPAKV